MKENIIINYLLLEQILRIIGAYETICDEYEFLPEIFRQAKTGDINSLFKDDEVKDTALRIIEDLTGVSTKYWSGQESIKLGIRCKVKYLPEENRDKEDIKHKNLCYDGDSIDNANIGIKTEEDFYAEHLENPLHLDYEELYEKVTGLKIGQDPVKESEHIVGIIRDIYSLKGLIIILLVNIKDANGIRLFDKRELLYKHTKWKPYMRELTKPTKHDITYCPKYVEIRKGLVQTIIQNILLTGYVPLTIKEL